MTDRARANSSAVTVADFDAFLTDLTLDRIAQIDRRLRFPQEPVQFQGHNHGIGELVLCSRVWRRVCECLI
jgi:hypothetical protein